MEPSHLPLEARPVLKSHFVRNHSHPMSEEGGRRNDRSNVDFTCTSVCTMAEGGQSQKRLAIEIELSSNFQKDPTQHHESKLHQLFIPRFY